MPTFFFKKLVRDLVLQRCLDDPKVRTDYRTLELQEFKQALVAKIHEEADEVPVVDDKHDDVLSEIADVQAVIDSLVEAYGYTKAEVTTAQHKKAVKNGVFEKRAYINSVELDDDSEWIAYFRQSPEKYEEQL